MDGGGRVFHSEESKAATVVGFSFDVEQQLAALGLPAGQAFLQSQVSSFKSYTSLSHTRAQFRPISPIHPPIKIVPRIVLVYLLAFLLACSLCC